MALSMTKPPPDYMSGTWAETQEHLWNAAYLLDAAGIPRRDTVEAGVALLIAERDRLRAELATAREDMTRRAYNL